MTTYVAQKLLLPILTLSLLIGCGAKTEVTLKPAPASLPIQSNEAIAILLGSYEHYKLKEADDPSLAAEKHANLEDRLDHCLARAAASHDPPIRTIPNPVIRDYLAQIYDLHRFDMETADLLSALKRPDGIGGIERTGLRYLVVADVETDRNSRLEPIFEAEGGGGGGCCILGVGEMGDRKSRVTLKIIDLRALSEAGGLHIESGGKHGWMAGVGIVIIIPVPYYIPWWAMTETEACDALGKSVIQSLTIDD